MSNYLNMLKISNDFPSPLALLPRPRKGVKFLILCPNDMMELFFRAHVVASTFFNRLIYFMHLLLIKL